MLSSLINITIRQSGNKPDISIQIEPSSITVAAFKELLESQHGIPATNLRLIHAGIILNDEFTLERYDIREGSVIHVIRSATNNSLLNEPTNSTASEGNSTSLLGLTSQNSESQLLRALSNNPAMRRLTENPELIRAVLLSNPQVRDVIEKNPEYGHLLSDPNFFRQGVEMVKNPDKMKEVLRNNDRAISNLEMLPGGFNHLKKIYQSLQEPMENAHRGQDNSSDALNKQYAEMYGVQMTEDNKVNTQPLPNPWCPPTQPPRSTRNRSQPWTPNVAIPQGILSSFNDLRTYSDRQKGSSGVGITALSQTPSQSSEAYRVEDMQERLRTMDFSSADSVQPGASTAAEPSGDLLSIYSTQIERLNEMGFNNLSDNLRALQASGGDIDDAVEWLLQLKG